MNYFDAVSKAIHETEPKPIDYAAIAKEIVADHTTHGYDPVYFDQGFSDTNEEAVTAFINGDNDGMTWREIAYDTLDEWVDDSVWHDATELTDQYAKENPHREDFDDDELRDAIRDELYDAITQDYAREWVTDMRNPAVRVQLDDSIDPTYVNAVDDVTPEIILKQAGIEATEKNLKAAQVVIDNAFYPGWWYNLFLVFQLDLSSVKDEGAKVRIKGEAELWATNVYAGDGMADTVEVDMVIDRSRLATDKEAPGYGYCDVFGTTAGYLPEPDVTFET